MKASKALDMVCAAVLIAAAVSKFAFPSDEHQSSVAPSISYSVAALELGLAGVFVSGRYPFACSIVMTTMGALFAGWHVQGMSPSTCGCLGALVTSQGAVLIAASFVLILGGLRLFVGSGVGLRRKSVEAASE